MSAAYRLLDRASSLLLLPLASVVVFAPSLGTFFAQDDFSLLARAQIANADLLWSNFTLFEGGIYRPLREVYFAALYGAFGLNPFAFHLIGLLLLIACAALLAVLARKLGVSSRGSLLAAVFYGSHSALLWLAMWSAAAGSLLAVFWSLLALLLLIDRPNKWRTAAGIACFAIALTAREVVVVVPFVLLLARLLPIAPLRTTERLKDRLVGPLAVLLVVGLYLTLRWSGTADLASSAAYRLDVGANVPLNCAKLAIYASGITGGGGWLGWAGMAAMVALFWALLGPTLLRSLLGDARTQLGLAWFVLGTLPVVFLARHTMDAYYLDFALLGLAIAVGSCYETIERRLVRFLKPAYVMCFLASVLVVANVALVNSTKGRSAVTIQAERAQLLLADVKAAQPTLPRGSSLAFEGLDEVTVWAMAFGELYRVGYADPSLRVFFASPPRNADERLFRFRLIDQRLVEVGLADAK